MPNYWMSNGHEPYHQTNSTTWLRKTKINIPNSVQEDFPGYATLRVGVDDLSKEILLALMPINGNGKLPLIYRGRVEDAKDSGDLSTTAKRLVKDDNELMKILELYNKNKSLVVDILRAA